MSERIHLRLNLNLIAVRLSGSLDCFAIAAYLLSVLLSEQMASSAVIVILAELVGLIFSDCVGLSPPKE